MSKEQVLDKGIRQKSTKRVNSFIVCCAFCPGPPNHDPKDSNKRLRVHTSQLQQWHATRSVLTSLPATHTEIGMPVLLQKIRHLRYKCISNAHAQAIPLTITKEHYVTTHTHCMSQNSLQGLTPFFQRAAECTHIFYGSLALHNPGLSDLISDSSARQDVRAY